MQVGGDLLVTDANYGAGLAVALEAPNGNITVSGAMGSASARLASVQAVAQNLTVNNIFTTGNIALAMGLNTGSVAGGPNSFLEITGNTLDSQSGAIILGSGAGRWRTG